MKRRQAVLRDMGEESLDLNGGFDHGFSKLATYSGEKVPRQQQWEEPVKPQKPKQPQQQRNNTILQPQDTPGEQFKFNFEEEGKQETKPVADLDMLLSGVPTKPQQQQQNALDALFNFATSPSQQPVQSNTNYDPFGSTNQNQLVP